MKVIETHLHTFYSKGDKLKFDGLCSPEEMISELVRKGYDCAAITDHNTTKGFIRGKKFSMRKFPNFILIPGMELDTTLPNKSVVHLLLYNENVENLESFKRNERIEEVLDKAKENNTLVVAAHPLSSYNYFNEKMLREFSNGINCIEVYNPFSFFVASRTERIARNLKKGMTAGSDAHSKEMVGIAYTVVKGNSLEEILEDLKERESPILVTQGYRSITPVLKWFASKLAANYSEIKEIVEKLRKCETEPKNNIEKFVKRFYPLIYPLNEAIARSKDIKLLKLIAYPLALETKIYSRIVTR